MTTCGSNLMRTRERKNKSAVSLWCFLFAAMAASSAFSQKMLESGEALELSKYNLSPVYSNDFSRPQNVVFEDSLIRTLANLKQVRASVPDTRAAWIAEGRGGVDIRNGKLRVSPLPFDASGNQIKSEPRSHMVVWSSQMFPADFLAEFEMNPSGSNNGLTIVFFSATGKNGEDLFDTSLPLREADYKNYHSGAIANYSDAYWSRNTDDEASTNRLRKNPGFALVAQGPSLTTGATDRMYRVRILKFGGHIEIEIDGHVVVKWDDTGTPLGAGRIGFRSMEGVSLITYDNFKVWKLSKK